MARDPKRKGTFSPLRLPVARRYLRPASRGRLLALGGVAALVLALLVVVDFFFHDGRWLTGGDLSSPHASLQGDCAACHDSFSGVTDEKCSSCHERYGDDLGVYSFATHYLYRSGDFQRLGKRDDEVSCAVCHLEHQGRDASITRVDDSPCLDCHLDHSFADDHPPFDVEPQPTGIAFGHIHHLRELMERREIDDVEEACLACHEPRDDGRHFEPLDFQRHCSACHLNGVGTPRLTIREGDKANGGTLGVETLESLRLASGDGVSWAHFANPAEYRRAGSRMMKFPVHHADPWVLENLRRLRRELHPDAGLADLLVASAAGFDGDPAELYREASDALRGRAEALRSHPSEAVQQELDALEILLDRADEKLRDPSTPLDENLFFLGPPAETRADQVEAVEELVEGLTQPCQPCHDVEQATIARVRADRQTWNRAEFNHRAHVLDLRCLDCHDQIPIAAALAGEDVDLSLDRAEVRNLPDLEGCRECHSPRQVSSACVTCHQLHPRQGHADLLRSAGGS